MPSHSQVFQVNVSYGEQTCNQYATVDCVGSLKDSVSYATAIIRRRVQNVCGEIPIINFVKLSHEVIGGRMVDSLHQRFVG